MEPRWLPSGAAADVLTYHNDNARTGQDLNETVLNPSNVNPSQFGELFTDPIDAYAYAQPLYMANVSIPGKGVHNVVFVATENDSVYALDADHPGPPLWHDSLVDPAAGVTPVPASNVGEDGFGNEIGITGTPVIDPSTDTLYVVTATMNVSGGNVSYQQQLHALDVASGAEKFGGPSTIAFSTPGRGAGHNKQGQIPFQARFQLQRSALLLLNDEVYVAWASYNDLGPYHGLVAGFNAQTLQLESFFNTTPNGKRGGIWMSGGGLSADQAGHIYLSTGNGTFDGVRDFGDSLLKLSSGPGPLHVLDYYTPKNQAELGAEDGDFGTSGVLLPPAQPGSNVQVAIASGKDGILDLVNRNQMGHLGGRRHGLLEALPQTHAHSQFSTAAYFNGAVYLGLIGDPIQEYRLVNGLLTPAPVSSAKTPFDYSGATPSISANGTSNGIVWVIQPQGVHNPTQGVAVLRAYDANNLSHEIYNSVQAGARDQTGPAGKFEVPTVANGKVYVATFTGLSVFGLLPTG